MTTSLLRNATVLSALILALVVVPVSQAAVTYPCASDLDKAYGLKLQYDQGETVGQICEDAVGTDPCDENPDECANCNGQPGSCGCDDENPPVTCPYDCSNPRDADYCHALYCQSHPDYSSCNGEQVKCADGFYGWDTDRDGTCDNDDLDDDNDGVPDTDDCDPSHTNPAVGAVDSVLYILGVQC